MSKQWRGGSTTAWRKVRAHVLQRDGYRCAVEDCATRADTVDHIVPKKRGGTDDPLNLRAMCGKHNYGRRDHDGDPQPRTDWLR